MRLATAFLSIVDPASAYMQSQGPGRRRRGPVFRGGAVYGPGVEGGARQATPEELAEMRARHDDADDPAQESALSRADFDPDAVRQAVRQLILRGETTLQGDSITLTARLVSFWHGDAVLDIRVTGPGFARSDLTRVTRRRSPADEGVFAEYIRSAARE